MSLLVCTLADRFPNEKALISANAACCVDLHPAGSAYESLHTSSQEDDNPAMHFAVQMPLNCLTCMMSSDITSVNEMLTTDSRKHAGKVIHIASAAPQADTAILCSVPEALS